ncbi:guanine nucleotide-binding 3-like [Venturia nashicola]|nr:guanine nucleotide-binding 3-like [Venturia nashicola]
MSPPPSSIPPPDGTPDRPAPANDSTSSRKSVHFKDPIATESAGLLSLAVANKARGRPKGKLMRPSSFPAPISLKKPSPPLPVKETRRSERVQVEEENASLKRPSLRKSLSDAQTSSPNTNDNGERRSGRSRSNVATYNDTQNTRASAGYKRPEADVATLPAKAHKVDEPQLPPTKTKIVWTEEEIALLKRLHREGLTVQEMIKHFDGRSYSAIIGRYTKLKLGPVNRASENLDIKNKRKRKTTAEEPTSVSSAKRRRANERSVSSSPSSQRSKPAAMPVTSPVQLTRNRSSNPPASSSPSTFRRIENPSKQNSALSPAHRKEPPCLVEGERPEEPARATNPVKNRALEENKATDEQEEDDSDTPEAQAHALIQENNESDGGNSPASGSDDDAYRKDRDDSTLDMDDDDPDAPLMHRLFHQFAKLKEVVVSVISLQAYVDELDLHRPVESPFEDFDTLRRKVRMSYKALLNPSTEEDAVAAPRTIKKGITKLQRLVKDLDPDAATVRRRQGLLKNIYAFVFPDLLKILATASYSLLVRTESDEDIVSSDLMGLIDITRCVTSLGSRAFKWKTKVDSDLALVKPVKNEIVAPLKKILREFEKHRYRLEAEEEETGRKLRRSQEVKRLRAEREIERERIAKLASKEDRMRVLYMWRANVESDLIRRFERLAMPNLRRRDRLYPLDANGQPFEREAVFKPRLSVPHMDRPSADDDDEDWTEEELEALQEGLAEIPHDELFWKKFYREYCHYRRNDDGSRGGPLRDRTVAEILKEMVRFRDYSIEDEAELPEWLLDIPDMDLVPFL